MSIAQNFPEIRPSLNLDFTNVKALDPRVTFARASTGAYYGTEVAKAEENLLLRSQEFDNAAWSKNGATATANTTTAPDGTTTAETLTCTASTTWNIFQGFTPISGQTYTYSIFAKADTTDFVQISTSAASRFANFDLLNGVVGTTGADATSQIIDIGNGWYRCSMVATGGLHFYVTVTGSSSAAHQTSSLGSVFLWGAQLEQRSAPTAYTPTTTQPITRFQPVLESEPAGVARFDHNPVTGESLGLLVEEQRTNLLTYSEQFDDVAWTKANATVVANQVIAPDGTLSADLLLNDSTNGEHRILSAIFAPVARTGAIYAKAGSASFMGLTLSGFGTRSAVFDLTLGVVSSVSSGTATIIDVGNGWYRCSFYGPDGSNYLIVNVGETAAQAVPQTSYVGTGKGIYIWGAQLESSSFSTSYIKTVASQVTRAADSASMVGANFSEWYRADEGTIYTEIITGPNSSAVDSDGDSSGAACFHDGTNNNRIRHAAGIISLDVRYAGSSVVSITVGSYAAKTTFKSASAYKTNDFQFSSNGLLGTADTSGNVPVVNALQIAASGITAAAGSLASGYIKKLAYYPVRVTNAQLQALTS